MTTFGRLLTAMVTPMKEDRSVDFERAGELAAHLVDNGSDGIVVAGTTGESPTLSDREKLDLFRAVVDAVGGKASVIAGTGSYATEHSTELTKAAEKTGVDGVMLVVPYYNKPPQDGLYHHFKTVAQATKLPVMLYNVPSRTSRNMEAATVIRLAEVDNIVAIKEASGDFAQVTEIVSETSEQFAVYSGDDPITLPMMAVGGVGIVSVASHVVGSRIKEMINAFLAGHVLDAARIHRELMPVFRGLFVTTNPIPVKTAMKMVGFDCGPFRLPLAEPSNAVKDQIEQALRKSRVL